MRYDGTPDKIGMNPYLTAKLGVRKREAGSAHRCEDKTEGNLAGAIDLQDYSMLLLDTKSAVFVVLSSSV